MSHLRKRSAALLCLILTESFARLSNAQSAPSPGGYSTQGNWQVGPQPTPYAPPSSSSSQEATDLELGVLYGAAVGYGVGTGIWLDAELSIDDPGLKFLAP